MNSDIGHEAAVPEGGRTILCIGFGYSARALAARLSLDGWSIIGSSRTEQGLERVSSHGATPVAFPSAELGEAARGADAILVSAGPGETGDPTLATLGDAFRAPLNAFWVGYLSTTGVYGDHRGGWVDETTPLNPATRRGRLRVAAELEWMKLHRERGLPLHIFRLAGIYGPGRGPFAKVRAGAARRLIKSGQVFSRIHVEDIATVLAASLKRPRPGAVYNVCDDEPAPPQDVIAEAARLLDMPPPPEVPFEDAELPPMARSFYAESKRVGNDLIKRELGVELAYPDYRSGLSSLLLAERSGAVR